MLRASLLVSLACSGLLASAQNTRPVTAPPFDPAEELLALSMNPIPFGSPAAVRQANGPVRISGGVMAGQVTSQVPPTYPPEARAKGISGAVVLSATIGKDGSVQNLSVISGPAALAEPAMDAVKQWTYKPYLLNGDPVEVRTTITVNFNLSGGR